MTALRPSLFGNPAPELAPLKFELDHDLSDKIRRAQQARVVRSGAPQTPVERTIEMPSEGEVVDLDAVARRLEAGRPTPRPAIPQLTEKDRAIQELRAIAMTQLADLHAVPNPYGVEVTHIEFGSENAESETTTMARLSSGHVDSSDPGAKFGTSHLVRERTVVMRAPKPRM